MTKAMPSAAPVPVLFTYVKLVVNLSTPCWIPKKAEEASPPAGVVRLRLLVSPAPLVPGQHVWAILGNPRFDKSVKTLVLTAEDLEDRYIDEK